MSTTLAPEIKLRPSDAHRWLVCRASPGYLWQLRDQLPPQDFEYTKEGQRAHEMAELWLTTKCKRQSDDIEMATHVKGYVDYCETKTRDFRKTHKSVGAFVELEMPLYYNAKRKGISDYVLASDDLLAVVDLKYGRGVSVQAKNNPQGLIYLRSAYEAMRKARGSDWRPGICIVVIYQPRVQGEEAVREWIITFEEMMRLTDGYASVAADILLDPFTQTFEPADKACQFCQAAGLCTHRTQHLLGDIDTSRTIEPVVAKQLPAPSTLSPDQLSRILLAAEPIRAYLAQLEKFALAAIHDRKINIPGFKVVATQPHQKWADPEAARDFLALYLEPHQFLKPSEPITPAQARQLLKRLKVEGLSELVTRPPGQPTLVTNDDKRPPYFDSAVAHEEFDDVVEGELL